MTQTAEQTEEDRRRFTRIPINRSVLAKTPNQESLFGTTSDICPCGIGFFSDIPLPKGAQIELALELEDTHHDYHDFHLTGHVAHCIDTMENGYHIGVCLDEPPEEYRHVIDELITHIRTP